MLISYFFGRLALPGNSQIQSHNLVNGDPFSEVLLLYK
jgi:hypothetical protein